MRWKCTVGFFLFVFPFIFCSLVSSEYLLTANLFRERLGTFMSERRKNAFEMKG